jgi:flagellar basal-body rod protein FlgC
MDVISGNLANANTTRGAGQEPYRRKLVVLAPEADGTVRIVDTVSDAAPFRESYEPGHPNADSRNIVQYSNVDPIAEMVDMISASRAYEANLNAFALTRQMIQSALDIGRV